MPRPKPPEPRKSREVRFEDSLWSFVQRRGGAKWLRGLVKTEHMRERQVLDMLDAGNTHRTIASELKMSTKTIQLIKTTWMPIQRKEA